MKSRILLLCILSLSLISWDRASKSLAKEYLANTPPRSFLNNTFRLEYVENTGAAMSMGDNLPPHLSFWLLGILPLTILLGLFTYLVTHTRNISLPRLTALTLIFAGGIGNILDRLLFDRHVSDFMIIKLFSLQTGIFNFADIWITAGVLWIALDSLKIKKQPAS
ncbi:MAG: signal peptidase II [Bacteroidetes bacterium]|nr:signal peptidase II [Bacteroidota bacterium]